MIILSDIIFRYRLCFLLPLSRKPGRAGYGRDTLDTTAPTIVSFTKTVAQGTPTNALPIALTLTFSEAMDAASITAADFSQDIAATATGVTWAVTPVSVPAVEAVI